MSLWRPRAGVAGLALCLLVFASHAQARLQLQLQDDTALTPVQVAASRQLLDEATQRLPQAWIEALDKPISVQWRDDLPAHVIGRAHARRMLLDRTLLDDWMASQARSASKASDSNDSATRAALAAIIHELAHFYDRTAQGRLSNDPRLLDLAGWSISPLWAWLGLRTSDNAFSDRSPDPYELTDPAEFVAVNLEYFLLDPAYACRRPALHGFFVEHFGMSPAQVECAPGVVFMQPAAETGGEQPVLLQLDSDRVYAVHYLLAQGNKRFMSRWGHSMLRLVICAPGRPRGPDCLLDLQYHRVLSFRAFVDDVQISSWRGLTGSYPSRLFVLPLTQVIDEYTKGQLRGLVSLPLQLEQEDIKTLLQRASQIHWSYDGHYYFLSNNCAVETFKLLHDGVARLADDDIASITPTGLLRNLKRADAVDATVLDDPAQALRLGYRFAPASAHYQAMFEVAKQALDLPQPRVEDWLNLPATKRAPWLQDAGMRASAALLLLEQAALRQQELLARDELKRRFLDPDNRLAAPEALATWQDALRLEGLLSHPASLLPNAGYGLPQQKERQILLQAGERYAAQWRRRDRHLRTQARRWLTPERRIALEMTEANIAALGEQLRRLHREHNGFELDSKSTDSMIDEQRTPTHRNKPVRSRAPYALPAVESAEPKQSPPPH